MIYSRARAFLLIAAVSALVPQAEVRGEAAAAADAPAKQRTFDFTYGTFIRDLRARQLARVWLPVPPSNEDQRVEVRQRRLPPSARDTTEARHGNKLIYVEAEADADGTLPLEVVYRVTRREVGEELAPEPGGASPAAADAEFLKPDKLVPVGGKPATLIAGKPLPQDQVKLARVLYDTVDDHMQYRKDQPGWGRGDASWACDSHFGNCTDFHSLFISLARTENIPSKFEIGFPVPEKRGHGEVTGYHCWAKFKPQGRGWTPVDISEANKNPAKRDYYFGHLCENRVAFSTGRDLELSPKQAGPPVNFLVYPYVEVDGKPYAAEQIERHFSYADVADGAAK